MSLLSKMNEKRNYSEIVEISVEAMMKDEPILTGTVRFFDPKTNVDGIIHGVINGDDGVSYDIALNPNDKKQVKLAKKIKSGMNIKFKDMDVEPPMAYISDFSLK